LLANKDAFYKWTQDSGIQDDDWRAVMAGKPEEGFSTGS